MPMKTLHQHFTSLLEGSVPGSFCSPLGAWAAFLPPSSLGELSLPRPSPTSPHWGSWACLAEWQVAEGLWVSN